MSPSLTTIPPEIHGLIGRHLCIRDLNSLSRTCKTLNQGFLASLYSYVVIRAPIKNIRLVSLENLVSSAGSGLKLTTGICITPQQQPSKDDTQDNEKDSTTRKDLCLPQASASNALNVMIRLLLRRIPNGQLKSFDYRHRCSLEISTLALLLKHQSATLHGLQITRYPEPPNISGLLVEGLHYLTITDLNIDQKCEWPSRLIMHNRKTLKHLGLGLLSTIARCPIRDRLKHKLPTSFAETTKGTSPASEPATEFLFLESLALNGLNLENIGGSVLNSQIDFKLLTALRVESCSKLDKAFTALVGNDNSTLSTLNLTSFFLRHEEGHPAFAQKLTLFLTSFAGLKHLSLLIEGQWTRSCLPEMSKIDSFRPMRTVEAVHLTRIGKGLSKGKDGSMTSTWQFEADCQQNLEMISRRLPKLRTLHLRNLPQIGLTKSYLPIDYLVKGIASNVLDSYAKSNPFNRRESLITIALGASIYRDVYIGSNHFPGDRVRDYLQLRVYHVDFNYQSVLGPSPTVTQVAKGFVDDVTICSDKDLLSEYWLS